MRVWVQLFAVSPSVAEVPSRRSPPIHCYAWVPRLKGRVNTHPDSRMLSCWRGLGAPCGSCRTSGQAASPGVIQKEGASTISPAVQETRRLPYVHSHTYSFMHCPLPFVSSLSHRKFPMILPRHTELDVILQFSWCSVDTNSCPIPLPSLPSPKLARVASVRNNLPIFRFIQTWLLFKAQIKCCFLGGYSPLSPYAHLRPPLLTPTHCTLAISHTAPCTWLGFRGVGTVWQTNHPLLGSGDWLWNFLRGMTARTIADI